MSLMTSLNSALNSLTAADGALQITNNNIANANTPSYSRQVADLREASPDGDSLGAGVDFAGFTSVRDELLIRQIQQQTSQQGGANAQLNALQQIEPAFTASQQDIGTRMSALFTSLSSLSTNPADGAMRQSVLSSAQNLVDAFHSTAASLQLQQTSADKQVVQDVAQINGLSQQIAMLNPKIAAASSQGQDAGSLQDQQDELVRQLAQLTNVSVAKSDSGVTLTAGNAVIVSGGQSYALQTSVGSDGAQHVLDHTGTDVTASISSGDLGGAIQTRDQTIPGLMSQLDTLAQQFANAFNAAQASGYDANGNIGTNFFNVPTAAAGAASSISVALTDASQIAASSDGSTGSNGNLSQFAAVQVNTLPLGSTPIDAYAKLVGQVGNLTANAQASSAATASSLQQLNAQLSSVSGVSVDEESTNLIKYQQAYEAAAHVISTVNNLFTVTMNMVSTS